MQEYNDKVVLITGAASGFGKILAEKLSASGVKLVLGDINEQELKKVAKELPGEVRALVCDVTKETQVEKLVMSSIETFGQLDIAINNAGMTHAAKPLIEITEADMDNDFAVNAKGVLFGMKYQIREMLKTGGGCILNVASMAGIGAAPKLAAYAAAKHAVVGITKTAAVEYGCKNIRVNAICPFYSPTPLFFNSGIGDKQEFLAQGTPMKRLGSPEEMVNAMLMVCSPANSYMNGLAIPVDGGVSAI